ncbi:unnamed protein product [Coffea canephora]|uniref:DPH-type MB domain-containing protein n=1 Tax=Coffea canephora TaxID=49390 RepID=A0A068TME8_COFCA|nr:unnamed protein product [Coffea canephora]
MSYDDAEIEDVEWNEELQAFMYPCPCGGLFRITREELRLGEEIARALAVLFTSPSSIIRKILPIPIARIRMSVFGL